MFPSVGSTSPSSNGKTSQVITPTLKKIPMSQVKDYAFDFILSHLRDRQIDDTLALNHLVRGKATSKGNNCLLHTIFQQITTLIPDVVLSKFVNHLRSRIHRTRGEMLSINDEEEGVRILQEVQRYLLDKTKTRYHFDLTVLFADNDGAIARVDMDQVTQKLRQDGASIPLRIIAVNYNHYEPLFVDDDVRDLAKQFDKMGLERSSKRSLPAYVVNIPMKVDSDEEGTDSGEESGNKSFSARMFSNPLDYFRLFPPDEGKTKINMRGAIVNRISSAECSIKSEGNGRLTSLIKLFEAEAAQLNGAQDGPARIGLTIGFNKMRSLSKRRNRTIHRCILEPTNSTLPVRKIGFLWDGVWQKRSHRSEEWKNADYKEVRRFYRQLKHQNPQQAEEFRAAVEKKRAHMVPYREIRDTIKNDDQTKQITQLFRKIDPNRDTYLAFLDGDLVSFHSRNGGPGPFSVFDEHYLATGFEIGSTGYTIRAPENLVLEVGVLADLAVRNGTAQHIRAGVYYPEPCTVVKIPPYSNTVPENFADPKDRNYKSPKEMPKLIEEVLARRRLSAQKSMIFDARGAIVTTLPKRMERSFSCRSTQENGIILWGLRDFKTMRDINQTHYNSRDWASNLLPALPICSRINFQGQQIDDQKVIHDVLVSLLSRLFSAYDPVDRAQRASVSSKRSFQACLVDIIKNYQADQIEELPAPSKDRPIHVPRKNAKDKDAAKAKCKLVNELWLKVDGLSSFDNFRQMLRSLLSQDYSRALISAAEESGKNLSALFRQRLCLNYEALVTHSLAKLIRDEQKTIRKLMPAIYYEIIGDSSLIQAGSINRTKAALEALNEEGAIDCFYKVTPLHIAALAGNAEMAGWILDHYRYCFDEMMEDRRGLIPFDYALEYCQNNGINIELLCSVCSNDKNILEVVQEKVREAFESEFDRAMIMSELLRKFGKDVIQDFDEYLFLEAVFQDYDDLAKELAGMGDYSSIIIDAIVTLAPEIDQRLIDWAEAEDLEEVRRQLSEFECMLFDMNRPLA